MADYPRILPAGATRGGREPLLEEIGKATGLSAEGVRAIMKLDREPISLETPIGEEEDARLGDLIWGS